MKKFLKTIAGVTLLEILLVLAVAAMIIVMSIRYYQSASNSEQANLAMQQVQSIAAAADNLALGSSTGYSGVLSSASLISLLGSNGLTSPNGSTIAVTASGATGYTVTMPLGTNVCNIVYTKLTTNNKITSATCASGNLTYTYDNTK